MRALVTGAGGFLGRAIARKLLDRGGSVRSLARGAYPELDDWGVESVRGDVADPQAVDGAVAGCDVVSTWRRGWAPGVRGPSTSAPT